MLQSYLLFACSALFQFPTFRKNYKRNVMKKCSRFFNVVNVVKTCSLAHVDTF